MHETLSTHRRARPLLLVGAEHTGSDWAAELGARAARSGFFLECVSLEDALSRLGPHRTPPDPGSTRAMVIALRDEDTRANLARLIDAAATSLLPAIVLTDSASAHHASLLRAEGIVTAPLGTGVEEVGTMLDTLVCRQHALDRLGADLRLSDLAIRGAQSEVAQIHDELRGAAGIQRQCLPRALPGPETLDIGVIFRPACYVSGDIYDIVVLDEHRTGFFLADAVGHGVPAALMTMIISQGLRTTDGSGATRTVVAPDEAIARLNRTMIDHPSDRSRFATGVYAVHDSRTRRVTISGAGHPPCMVVRAATGRTEYIESGGPLLGVFPDARFDATTIELDSDDMLVLYSDGFEVAFPEPDADEHNRRLPTSNHLARLACASDGGTLQDAARAIERAIDGQRGSLNQRDDITAIFVSPRAVSAPRSAGSASHGAAAL